MKSFKIFLDLLNKFVFAFKMGFRMGGGGGLVSYLKFYTNLYRELF
jgi:hypothetical protein